MYDLNEMIKEPDTAKAWRMNGYNWFWLWLELGRIYQEKWLEALRKYVVEDKR
jgi:hypothetical protein